MLFYSTLTNQPKEKTLHRTTDQHRLNFLAAVVAGKPGCQSLDIENR
jgi:hypothetical protein